MNPLISIIIPCKDIDPQTSECIQKCKELDYDNFEIIVLPDHEHSISSKLKIVATGEVSPGKKRNIGEQNSTGEFLAFIDSDAYPQKEWLKNAMRYFNDSDIAAVGGPGITPDTDSILQKAGGYILSSFMMGGLSNRYTTGRSFASDDIHSCNFIIRKSVLEEIGGWDEKYWPGEDTLLCLGVKRTGKKMIEARDIIVFHHRRPLFKRHLIQVSRFGLHRGFFAKKFPNTSLRMNYFIPSIFVIFIISGGIFSFIEYPLKLFYLLILSIYLLAVMAVSLAATASGKDIRYFPLVYAGTIITHLVYGINFLKGLASSELER